MRNYTALLDAGTAAQLEKLKVNEHKKGFNNIDLGYAYNRTREELNELWLEIAKNNPNYKAIRLEAADVANFAHMIIFKCDQELKK